MDSDKKTHGFCKAELRKRFRLVFYLGKLSLAAYSEQFGKPGRNPTGPAHASRLVFTDHNRPPTAAMRQRHNEEGRCAADHCSQPRGSRRPWQKAAHPARHPSLAGCSKRIASLIPITAQDKPPMNFGSEHSAHCLRYGQAPRGRRSGASGWPSAPAPKRARGRCHRRRPPLRTTDRKLPGAGATAR